MLAGPSPLPTFSWEPVRGLRAQLTLHSLSLARNTGILYIITAGAESVALAPSHVSCVTWEGHLNSTESQAQMGGANTDFLGEWLRTTWNKIYEALDAAPGTQRDG